MYKAGLRKISPTWNYFNQISHEKTKYDLYSEILTSKVGSVNLSRHLKARHPGVVCSPSLAAIATSMGPVDEKLLGSTPA